MDFKLMKNLALEVIARRATAISPLHVDAVEACLHLAERTRGVGEVNVQLRLRLSAKEDQLRLLALERARQGI